MDINSVLIYSSLKVYTFFSKLSISRRWKRKSRKLIRLSGVKKLSREQEKDIRTHFSNLGHQNININWHRFYIGCNQLFSANYIPENLFYMKIEPKLNRTSFTEALADKNLLSNIFEDINQPETVVKNVNGFYYSSEDLVSKEKAQEKCESQKLIIKPTIDTGGGKNVLIFNTKNGETDYKNLNIEKLFKEYGKDFIVQKIVSQHPKMEQLNSTSLNTFRVMSFLSGVDIKILSIIVRMGKEGSITDNSTTGGLSCGVNEDGSLNPVGFENNTGRAYECTDAGIPFKKIKLPFTRDIYNLVNKMHKKVPYFRLISWDLAVENSGELVLVEYNISGQDVNFHQLNNGPVLKDLLEDPMITTP